MSSGSESPVRLFGDVIRRVQWGPKGRPQGASPKVAIVASYTGMSICTTHVPGIAEVVAREIESAGGLGIIVPTAAPCDAVFFANGQAPRLAGTFDRIVADVEAAVHGAQLDALVLLTSCDTTAPAHLVAAARIDVPAVVLACGYQTPGAIDGRRIDLMEVYEAVGGAVTGKIPKERINAMASSCATGPGVCPGLGTATTLHMAAEALGLAPLGNSPVAGSSERLRTQARAAAQAIISVARLGLTPRRILTADAIADAVRFVLAVGGAASSFGFLQRLSDELSLCDADGQPLDVRRLAEQMADEVSQLCFVSPAGEAPVEALDQAGGAAQVLKRLAPSLSLDRPVVVGGTLGQALNGVPLVETPLFAKADAGSRDDGAGSGEPGLMIMRGDLAPGGGIVRPGCIGAAPRRFVGSALVLENSTRAYEALAGGDIKPGDVVVIRGAGLDDFGCALYGSGLADRVAMLSDGGHSGLAKGLGVAFIRPSAADGGPIKDIRDGDRIAIDLDARTVERVLQED